MREFLILIIALTWQVNSLACNEELWAKLAKIHPSVSEAAKAVASLNEHLATWPSTPTWSDFESVANASKLVDAAREAVPNLDNRIRRQTKALQAAAQIEGTFDGVERKTYQPTEHGLRRALTRKVIELNRKLPRSLRIPLRKPAPDPRPPLVLAQAREIIADQTKRMEELYPTTGFANHDEFIEVLKAAGGEEAALLEMFQSGQIQVVIYRPEAGRFWIPKVGFHNQFVTHSSRGSLSPDYRHQVESELLGIPLETYSTLDNEVKPKYLTLRPAPGSKWLDGSNVSHYGPDRYILDTPQIADRLTWTLGDSLNRHSSVETPNSWDQIFVPWNRRELMIPWLANGVRASEKYYLRHDPPSRVVVTKAMRIGSLYTEGQVFGPLDMRAVVGFEFTGRPPEGEFLKELQKRKIKIFDARDESNVVPWTPSDEVTP